MSTQLTAEQKLETQVKDLKSRILDTQDALTQAQAQGRELIGVLSELAQVVGLTGNAEGQIQLVDLVETVKVLVANAAQGEASQTEAAE